MIHILPSPKWNPQRKRWELRLQVDNHRKQFTSSLPRTEGKNECKAKASKWLDSLESNGSVTFGTAFERFLDDYKLRFGETAQYKNICGISRTHIIPKIGKMRCADIRIEDYQAVITEAKPIARIYPSGKAVKRTERLSKKYLKNIRSVLIQFNKWAVARKYTDIRLDSILYVPQNAPEGSRSILQLEDIEKVFSEPTGLPMERALMFEILTGLRPGEVCGLKIEDYDRSTGIIHIRRAINAHNEITPGKNRNARRDILLPDRVRQIVEEQIAVSESCHSEWLFCQPSGQHGTQRMLQNHWKRICAAHGLADDTTPYSLRHTFYTHTEAFLPDRMIKMVFGHSEKTDGHHIYGDHAIDGELKDAADKLAITPIYKAANN